MTKNEQNGQILKWHLFGHVTLKTKIATITNCQICDVTWPCQLHKFGSLPPWNIFLVKFLQFLQKSLLFLLITILKLLL